jgi:hypothetical protein
MMKTCDLCPSTFEVYYLADWNRIVNHERFHLFARKQHRNTTQGEVVWT